MVESVEMNMAEVEIDREYVNERKKWRKNIMERKSNPSETNYNPIIIIMTSVILTGYCSITIFQEVKNNNSSFMCYE